jgi:hypothetical protein
MKKILASILALLLSTTAMAQWDSAVIVASSIGVVVGSQVAVYESLVKRELKGWANKETGTTVKLENQCGLQTEFHLLGDYRQNYIMMGITNATDLQMGIKFRDVRFIINNARDRYPGYSYTVSDQMVNPNWWTLASIPLPDKSEFKEYETLRVEIPVYQPGKKDVCKIVTEFKRSKHVEAEEAVYSVFDFTFDLGPSLAQTGNAQSLGSPEMLWGMDFNFYFRPNHGFGLGFLSENGFEGSRRVGRIYRGNMLSFDMHYVYRHFVASKWYVNFEPGVGFQSLIEDYSCRYCDQTLSSAFMLNYRLMLNYVIGHWNIDNMNIMDFFVGGGIVQQWAPHESYRGKDVSGSRIGALARFGMAF